MDFEYKMEDSMRIARERIKRVRNYIEKGLSSREAEYLSDTDRLLEQGAELDKEQKEKRKKYLAEIGLE